MNKPPRICTTEPLLQALEAQRLHQGTTYQEKDMPLLNRLFERLAKAIASKQAPPPPKLDDPIVAGKRQTKKKFTLQLSPVAKKLFRRFDQSSVQGTAIFLLSWAIACPAPPAIASPDALLEALQASSSNLSVEALPDEDALFELVRDRLTRKAFKAWFSSLLLEGQVPAAVEQDLTEPDWFYKALRERYDYSKLIPTRQLRQDFQELDSRQLTRLVEQLHVQNKVGVRWGNGESLILSLPNHSPQAANRIELLMPVAASKVIALATARLLLHKRESVLTHDGFQDGYRFPIQVNYSSEAIGLLVPKPLAKVICTGEKAVDVDVSDFPEPMDWHHKLKSLFSGLQEGAIDVVWLRLKDRQTEVAIVSPRAIDFDRWEIIDNTLPDN